MKINLTRRAALAGFIAGPIAAEPIAALGANALPAPDPIFAAIAAYRTSEAACERTRAEYARLLDDHAYKDDDIYEVTSSSPEWRAHDAALAVEDQRFGELVATVPTALAGVAALASFVRTDLFRDDGEAAFVAEISRSILQSLEQAAVALTCDQSR
jgi:hypothetical protein